MVFVVTKTNFFVIETEYKCLLHMKVDQKLKR